MWLCCFFFPIVLRCVSFFGSPFRFFCTMALWAHNSRKIEVSIVQITVNRTHTISSGICVCEYWVPYWHCFATNDFLNYNATQSDFFFALSGDCWEKQSPKTTSNKSTKIYIEKSTRNWDLKRVQTIETNGRKTKLLWTLYTHSWLLQLHCSTYLIQRPSCFNRNEREIEKEGETRRIKKHKENLINSKITE